MIITIIIRIIVTITKTKLLLFAIHKPYINIRILLLARTTIPPFPSPASGCHSAKVESYPTAPKLYLFIYVNRPMMPSPPPHLPPYTA